MADDLEAKRAELRRVYDKLEQLEKSNAEPILVKTYRALARQLADEITNMKQP